MSKPILNTQVLLGTQKLDRLLKSARTQALLISSAYNIAYLTGFFGFSKTEREGYLLVTSNNVYIFASGLNSEAVSEHIDSVYSSSETRSGESRSSRQARTITLIQISPRTPLTKKALAQIIRKEKIKRLGFEKHTLSYAEYEKLCRDLTSPRGWPKDSPEVELIPTEYLIEELRMVKTADEISAVEKACKLGDKAFGYILGKIKKGITEKALAFELEVFIRKHGAEISFPPIVAIDPNSSIPHHVTSDKQLLPIRHSGNPPSGGASRIPAQIVLLDFGVKVDNYCSDMTRTVFFGKASAEQRRMYQTVLEAEKRAIEFIKKHLGGGRMDSPEVDIQMKARDVDKAARDYITSKGFPTIPHYLGHGIGLEVHEPPRLSLKSKDVLKPGMVFSIEPGIYQPGIGGVRIEDLVILESSGPRLLTNAGRELIEVKL